MIKFRYELADIGNHELKEEIDIEASGTLDAIVMAFHNLTERILLTMSEKHQVGIEEAYAFVMAVMIALRTAQGKAASDNPETELPEIANELETIADVFRNTAKFGKEMLS